MALEPGGFADKLGNRYEGQWVVRQLLRLLNEDVLSVTVEAIGDDEEGVDLWINRKDGSRQAQQCKVRNRGLDAWTVADLNSRGILTKMASQLDREPTNEFALVTAVPSVPVHDLCISARSSNGNPEDFYTYQVQAIGEERRKTYRQFARYLGLNEEQESDRARVFDYLRRTYIELWPDTVTSREELLDFAGVLVNDDPETVVALLSDFAQQPANYRITITASAVWDHLASHDAHPRRLANDPRTLPGIHELRKRFVDSIKGDLIAGDLIARQESNAALDALNESNLVVLHGRPGMGKSAVLYELTKALDDRSWVFLPVRLDRDEPKNSPRQFGEELGLPESPVKCLEAVAGDQPAVLILDQLDAIRWTSRHSLNALDVCKALVREAKALRGLGRTIGVVLACRTYDLQNDPEIKNWLSNEDATPGNVRRIEIAPLTKADVVTVANKLNQDIGKLSDRQQEILTSPQHLSMWSHLVQIGVSVDFRNRVQLMRAYWEACIRELVGKQVSVDDANAALATLIDYMEQKNRVSAPRSLVTNSAILNALCACGLLQFAGGQVTFSHQSYLDFQIALRVVHQIHVGAGGVVQWLGPPEQQSLFRREQLRQALCLLHEESPEELLTTIREVLESESIRFHLKHLVLEVLGQFDDLDDGLLDYTKSLANDSRWKEHVLGTVYRGHAPFVERLIDDGTIADWLDSVDQRDPALWLLRSVAEALPDKVTSCLWRHASSGDEEWRRRILAAICWNPKDDSDAMFGLRLELAREGTYKDYLSWEKLPGERALRMLDAILCSVAVEDVQLGDSWRTKRSRRIDRWTKEDTNALQTAARNLAALAWDLLVPHISRLCPADSSNSHAIELWMDGSLIDASNDDNLPHGVLSLAIEAGQGLASTDGNHFWNRTETLREHSSPVIQLLLIESYSTIETTSADQVLTWLVADSTRLNIGTGENEPEWMSAARLIKALTPHCSDEVFRLVEETITRYRSPRERRDAEYWLPSWKEGYYGDYWGRAQHFLLPALCEARRSGATVGLIGVLERKFDGYADERFTRSARSRAGFVGSTLPTDCLERISDNAWLGIIGNKKIPLDHGSRSGFKGDHWEESTIEQFARNLESVAKRFPERCGRLALRLPEDVHPRYKAAILEGLQQTEANNVPEGELASWVPASVGLIEDVLAHFGEDLSRTYASRFCWLMKGRASENWSESAISRLLDFACNHPDPEETALSVSNPGGDFDQQKASVHTLHTNSINCVRGVAACAIGAILRNRPELLARVRDAIEQLTCDPHPSVRMASIEACLPVLGIDKDAAVRWFYQAGKDDLRIAASPYGVYFFNIGTVSHFDDLGALIVRMMQAEPTDVVKEGTQEIAARWLFHDYFDDELKECLSGSRVQRKGVATIAAQFVSNPEYFEKCRGLIDQLSHDPDREVRQELTLMFRNGAILSTSQGINLVRRLIDSPVFSDDPTDLIECLNAHSCDLLAFADVLLAVCDQFVGPLRDASRDSSSGIAWDMSRYLPLMLRLYEQANDRKDSEVVNRCLDTWDAMFESRVGVIGELTRVID